MAPLTLNFITSSPQKLAEARAILSGVPDIKLTSHALDLVEVQSASNEEVVRDKCRRAGEVVGGPVLTEDTCLCFNALNGMPGPYIKWFLQAIGREGLYNLLAAYEDKSAQVVCTFAYCEGPGQDVKIFEGRVHGKIVCPRGPPNFGWDPIFEYEGETYAEMDDAKKNQISHRALALAKFKEWLQTRTETQS